MNLSGKKLTTAILAGLMGATVAGISVVGAANQVVLDRTTLKVSLASGEIKPIMRPVNVPHGINVYGIKDGTTTKGNIVKADSTVGANLNALDTAVVGKADKADLAAKADKADLAAKADKADFDALKTKVDTAVHVSKDGNLIVGTKPNQVVNNAKINGKFTAENIDVKENITAGGDITAKGKVTAAAVVDNTTKKGNYIKEGATVGNNLNILDDAINTNKEAIDANKNAIADNKKAADTAIQANKEAIATNTNAIAANTAAIGTTKDGNYVKAENSVGQNLNALDEQVGQNSANINRLFSDYSSLKTDINKVGARSAALAGLHPLDFDSANKLNFAVASGSFKGENSVALGAFYRPNENIMFSAASTMGDSDNAYTFGLSFKIGPSSAKTKTTSPDAEELYKVVGELQDQLAAQQKEIEQLKADKAK